MEPVIVEIMGHRVELYKITNSALRRVVEERMSRNDFLFYHREYYDEHTDITRSTPGWGGQPGWNEYTAHNEYKEKK